MPSWLKKTVNITFTLLWSWHAFFWSWRPWTLPLWWLGFCFWVILIVPRFITGSYCLHEVCGLIRTLQQIPGCCKASLFLLGCQQLWDRFHWDACCAQIYCSEPIENPNSLERSLIVTLGWSNTTKRTLSIIIWFLLWRVSMNFRHSRLTSVPLWTT